MNAEIETIVNHHFGIKANLSKNEVRKLALAIEQAVLVRVLKRVSNAMYQGDKDATRNYQTQAR